MKMEFIVTAALLLTPLTLMAQLTEVESSCAARVQDNVAWDQQGNKRWVDSNIQYLCRDSLNDNVTIACFTSEINRGYPWDTAAQNCRYSQTIGIKNHWRKSNISWTGRELTLTNDSTAFFNLTRTGITKEYSIESLISRTTRSESGTEPGNTYQRSGLNIAIDRSAGQLGLLDYSSGDESLWSIEYVGYGNYFRIKNRLFGTYLHTQNGPLTAGNIEEGWWSAMWTFEAAGDQ